MGKGRTSKYPILLIEREFIQKRLTFKELSAKYNISIDLLSYHSRRHNWLQRRKKLYEKTTIAIAKQKDIKAAEVAAKEELTIVQTFERLLKLKLDAETKVFLNTQDIKTKKELMYLINKSKDSTTEIMKLLELLKGNVTDRVEITEKEKATRYNRLKEFMTTG